MTLTSAHFRSLGFMGRPADIFYQIDPEKFKILDNQEVRNALFERYGYEEAMKANEHVNTLLGWKKARRGIKEGEKPICFIIEDGNVSPVYHLFQTSLQKQESRN